MKIRLEYRNQGGRISARIHIGEVCSHWVYSQREARRVLQEWSDTHAVGNFYLSRVQELIIRSELPVGEEGEEGAVYILLVFGDRPYTRAEMDLMFFQAHGFLPYSKKEYGLN